MYRINKSSNNITKLEEREFKDLGFRERDHLQEWIAKNPRMGMKDKDQFGSESRLNSYN